jgi:hypothetical protein
VLRPSPTDRVKVSSNIINSVIAIVFAIITSRLSLFVVSASSFVIVFAIAVNVFFRYFCACTVSWSASASVNTVSICIFVFVSRVGLRHHLCYHHHTIGHHLLSVPCPCRHCCSYSSSCFVAVCIITSAIIITVVVVVLKGVPNGVFCSCVCVAGVGCPGFRVSRSRSRSHSRWARGCDPPRLIPSKFRRNRRDTRDALSRRPTRHDPSVPSSG